MAEQFAVNGVTARTLEILRGFTDARAVDGSIVSKDGPFTYIARTVSDQAATTSVGWLHLRFFNRVLSLWHDNHGLAASVRQAASRDGYVDAIGAVDRWLDDPHPPKDFDGRPALLRALDPSGEKGRDEWRLLLAGSPRISQVPREYLLADPAELPKYPGEFKDYSEDPDTYHRAAQVLLDAARAADEDFDACAEARLAVALDLVRRRRFAKVRMLEVGWPELVERVRTPGGRRRLRQLEARVLGDTDTEALPEAWQSAESDERLSEFLRIGPYFRTIFDDQFARVVGVVEGSASLAASMVTWEPYADIELHLEPPDQTRAVKSPNQTTAARRPKLLRWRGIARLAIGPDHHRWPVEIDVEKFRRLAASLLNAYASAYTIAARPSTTTRDVAPAPSAAATVEQIGELLWHQTFGAQAEATSKFLTVMNAGKRVRLTISSGMADLTGLPWECLQIPDLRIVAGLTVKLSVVRRVGDAIAGDRSIGTTLRVLAVHSEPRGLAQLPGARQELRLLRASFAEAEQQGWASLTTIEDATERDLRESLRRVRPHVLHYTGHSGIINDTATLILQDHHGAPALLTAEQLAVQLWDSGVVLAVLNGCDTGVDPGVPGQAAFGVCQNIVRQGVPAVVATIRPVLDNAGLRFAQEFYQALMDGYPLEASVTEARKGIFMQGWDWSAWALFAADPSALEPVRLRRPGGLIV
ncbi:CHAT domain-containing protein [Actinoplanes derwentensis]|uniref:CHAT domain-containing protein n=1 Tax=Actinoplanes derwentensis TaxID=113562 RepID=A0A1H1XR35_9ACTN|nr:CHAT domain-containing protein [Actinoplanes derwentensis]SDT11511.1 CHAT domain-containing protein [Actinoplanes derwentensis]